MKIEIEIKPLSEIRNNQVGDYFYKPDGTLVFHIADMGNDFYIKSILLHELFEEMTTKQNGISEQDITDFDAFYEMKRKQGLVPENAENGFDNAAPYKSEHSAATACELMAFAITHMSWVDYEHAINFL